MFNSIQEFRARATEDDVKALREYIAGSKKKADAFPCEEYGFSYTSAANYLKELDKAAEEEAAPEFTIRSGSRTAKFVNRSFSVREDILQRLDQMADDNWMYSKKAVINELLDESLKKYGY